MDKEYIPYPVNRLMKQLASKQKAAAFASLRFAESCLGFGSCERTTQCVVAAFLDALISSQLVGHLKYPMNELDWPPMIDMQGLPENEREKAWLITTHIMRLKTYIDQAQNTLDLVAFAERELIAIRQRTSELLPQYDPSIHQEIDQLSAARTTLAGWTMLAGRDAGMTVYHFAEAMEAAKAMVRECPTLKATIDWKLVRSVQKVFSADFPQYENFRHAIAHDAQLTDSPKSSERNSHSGDYDDGHVRMEGNVSGVRITGNIGGAATVTIKGKILKLDLSPGLVTNLKKTAINFWACFKEAERITREAAVKARTEATAARQQED